MPRHPRSDTNDGSANARAPESAILSDTAAELLSAAHAPADLYRIIAAPAHRLSGAFVTVVSAYSPERKTVHMVHSIGLGPMIDFARRLGLGHLTETDVPLSAMTEEEVRNFTSGKLYRLQGGLHALSGRTLSARFCALVEKTFRLRAVWSMGFSWEGRLYGGISLIVREDVPVPHAALVEAIVKLGAVALHGAYADQERSRLREQLLQSQKMEAVGRLAAGIAHDFNNLLTVITGASEMMAETMPKDLPFAVEVDHIREAARRASDLTRQLLSFSRKEMEQPAVIRSSEAMEGMSGLLRRVIGEDMALELELGGGGECFRMDPSQLTQVMLNLATNARDAMPKGGTLRVESGCASVEEDKAQALGLAGAGLYVSISVSDTGTGMEEATLSHLFEPFFTTKEQGKGTGLGLSTVYGIVRQAGGAVSVQSAHQKGTRVTILLPCVACVPSEKPRPVEAESGQGSGAILLVEDDESVRRYVARLLVRRGYLVHQAADGAQALAELDTLSPAPALLITDLVMPGMTGRELADKVRDRAPRVAVLFVSGYSEDAVVRRGLETGTIDFLRKPFAPNELLSHVARLLGAC